MRIKRLFNKTILCYILFLLLSQESANAQDPLTLSVHPYLPATKLIKRFNPLAKYLSKTINRPISIKIQKSYQSQIESTGKDLADIAYLGPASYVMVTDSYGKKPLLARLEIKGASVFHGMIIVRKDSPVQTLGDLINKSFAFGDPNSTMSYLVPKFMLMKAGVSVESLKEHNFLNSHHNVALGVLGEYYDAGGVKEEVFYEYQQRGLRMLAKSSPISEHVFVTRSSLPVKTIQKLRKAFLGLNDYEHASNILTSIKKTVTGMATVVDEDYDSLREILKVTGKLKE